MLFKLKLLTVICLLFAISKAQDDLTAAVTNEEETDTKPTLSENPLLSSSTQTVAEKEIPATTLAPPPSPIQEVPSTLASPSPIQEEVPSTLASPSPILEVPLASPGPHTFNRYPVYAQSQAYHPLYPGYYYPQLVTMPPAYIYPQRPYYYPINSYHIAQPHHIQLYPSNNVMQYYKSGAYTPFIPSTPDYYRNQFAGHY